MSHTLPLTETSTIGETNDVIAVNGEERTDRLAIDCYHKGVTLSVFGWGVVWVFDRLIKLCLLTE
ncbi:hypothetical protein [Limnospira platensis]|uniref:hypothetical protein n=1 Tax=Limnospira platensis TaxID=118562 RepID=UPI003D6FE567